MTTFLSSNFTVEEATRSETASRLQLDNSPSKEVLENLRQTAYGMEQVRKLLSDYPIIVSSWYRAPAVNSAIGSKPTSQHVTGQAVDFICPSYGNVDAVITAIIGSRIDYDQLIKEFVDPKTKKGGWIHISFNSTPRRQALVIDQSGVRAYA